MELTPIYRRVVALDVHQAKLTVCALFENAEGEAQVELREFGGFKRDRRAMAEWVAAFEPEAVVMESTGIYWKSPYAALEKVGIVACNANWCLFDPFARAKASTTEEPDAGKLHVRVCGGGSG